MDWLLQHLQLVIAGAGAIAWWLGQRRQAAARTGQNPAEEMRPDEPDVSERTRRIREEIQRKIERRTGGNTPSPTSKSSDQRLPPVIVRRRVEKEDPPRPKSRIATEEAEKRDEVLLKQIALAEELRRAVEIKAASLRRVQSLSPISAGGQIGGLGISRTALLADLKDVEGLRRAFIVREIIGPPVALR